MVQIKTWAQAEQALAEQWGSFQPRPQQRTLAHAVAETVNGNSKYPVRLAQAGCGVGKSLGYLIPAIASGKRTVVSVSTKALQDQLFSKDLPTLQKNLFPNMRYAVLKGRSNYVCLRAADKNGADASCQAGSAGERSDLVRPADDDRWRQITTDAEGCIGRKACPFADQCYSEVAKQRALEANVLVVNTSLLTMDLRLRSMTRGKASLVGNYDVLIVDEAHEMAEIVSSGLSTSVTLRRILDTTSKLVYHLDGEDTAAQVDRVNTQASRYFNTVREWFEAQRSEIRTAEMDDVDMKAVSGVLAELQPLVSKVNRAQCSCEPVFDPETGEDDLVCEFAKRTTSLINDLTVFCDTTSADHVQWMERGQRGTVELKCAPTEVGGWLRAALWEPSFEEAPRYKILTSATLAVGGDFAYISRRLGIPAFEDLDVGTPFDFEKQMRLYLPPVSAPSPKQRNEWLTWSRDQMRDLIAASDGDALLLFTSTSAMREAHNALSSTFRRNGMTVLLQGDGMDNRTLAQTYAKTPRAVLFATRSFMTGVDFPGKKLVVVDKLPFPVPEDPVFKARCKAVEDRFGERSSFRRVSLPDMSLVLIQAFGRLIRSVDDHGVVAILDSRMRAGWAAPIRASLPAPKSATVDSIQRVTQFYQDLKAARLAARYND